MTFQLNYRGQLAIAARNPSEEINPRPGTPIADLIRAAAARHGEEFSRLILAADGTFRQLHLFGILDLFAIEGDQ